MNQIIKSKKGLRMAHLNLYILIKKANIQNLKGPLRVRTDKRLIDSSAIAKPRQDRC
jgi:hypothetical protein